MSPMSLLVFRRKDLCEARLKSEVSSKRQMDPPTNQAQVYRALPHLDCMIYWEIDTYPGQTDTPTNWAQVYRALLHLDSMIYWEINTYPRQMDPPLIKHRSIELYYTWTVWSIEKLTHTQGRWTPTNQEQVYRALLHQHSMIYSEIKT